MTDCLCGIDHELEAEQLEYLGLPPITRYGVERRGEPIREFSNSHDARMYFNQTEELEVAARMSALEVLQQEPWTDDAN
jgi:hypothetical protein